MAMVISFFNQKGGATKTTNCYKTAHFLTLIPEKQTGLKRKFKVAILDVDAQKTCFQNQLLFHVAKDEFDVFIPLSYPIPDFKSLNQTEIASLIANTKNIEYDYKVINSCIEDLKGKYDYLFIDIPGAFNQNVISALKFSDIVIIPFQPTHSDIPTTIKSVGNCESINSVKKDFKFKIAILPTRVKTKKDIETYITYPDIMMIKEKHHLFENYIEDRQAYKNYQEKITVNYADFRGYIDELIQIMAQVSKEKYLQKEK